MVAIVVHEQKPVALILNFESTASMLEPAKRRRDLVEGHPELGGQRNNTDGILHIVPAGNVQHCLTQLLCCGSIGTENGGKFFMSRCRRPA